MTPEEIRNAADELHDFDAMVVEWARASLITKITFYYNGYPSHDTRDEALIKMLRMHTVSFYREAIFTQLKALEKLGVNTSGLQPEGL